MLASVMSAMWLSLILRSGCWKSQGIYFIRQYICLGFIYSCSTGCNITLEHLKIYLAHWAKIYWFGMIKTYNMEYVIDCQPSSFLYFSRVHHVIVISMITANGVFLQCMCIRSYIHIHHTYIYIGFISGADCHCKIFHYKRYTYICLYVFLFYSYIKL